MPRRPWPPWRPGLALAGSSARRRWVLEYSKHRRTATRQRGICGSLPEISRLIRASREYLGKTAASRSLLGRPPEGSSREHRTATFRGVGWLCQSLAQPFVGFDSRHGDIRGRDYEDGTSGTVGQGIDLIASSDAQRPAAMQEKRHVGSQPRCDFRQTTRPCASP